MCKKRDVKHLNKENHRGDVDQSMFTWLTSISVKTNKTWTIWLKCWGIMLIIGLQANFREEFMLKPISQWKQQFIYLSFAIRCSKLLFHFYSWNTLSVLLFLVVHIHKTGFSGYLLYTAGYNKYNINSNIIAFLTPTASRKKWLCLSKLSYLIVFMMQHNMPSALLGTLGL